MLQQPRFRLNLGYVLIALGAPQIVIGLVFMFLPSTILDHALGYKASLRLFEHVHIISLVFLGMGGAYSFIFGASRVIAGWYGTQRLQQAVALIGLIHALFDLFSLLTVKAIANDEMMTSVLRPNMVYEAYVVVSWDIITIAGLGSGLLVAFLCPPQPAMAKRHKYKKSTDDFAMYHAHQSDVL